MKIQDEKGNFITLPRQKSHKLYAPKAKEIKKRLEYLRGEIKAERISYGEIAELQGLAKHIAPDDVELLEWAGVKERPNA